MEYIKTYNAVNKRDKGKCSICGKSCYNTRIFTRSTYTYKDFFNSISKKRAPRRADFVTVCTQCAKNYKESQRAARSRSGNYDLFIMELTPDGIREER